MREGGFSLLGDPAGVPNSSCEVLTCFKKSNVECLARKGVTDAGTLCTFLPRVRCVGCIVENFDGGADIDMNGGVSTGAPNRIFRLSRGVPPRPIPVSARAFKIFNPFGLPGPPEGILVAASFFCRLR